MMGNGRQNEEPTVDPITMMMAMKEELENMKHKNKGPKSREQVDEEKIEPKKYPSCPRGFEEP